MTATAMAKQEPDYKRPFDREDFRGYFSWSQATTDLFGGSLYHACHQDELEQILEDGLLGLRSHWSLKLPKHGLWTAPGVWTGLNYYVNGNRYGPFLLEFPLSVLNGMHFMVFRRTGGRNRYFFVEYEARIPVYSFGKELWRKVSPKHYVETAGTGAIWDIVLTQPILIDDAVVRPVEHPSCIPGKCNGTTKGTNRKALDQVIRGQFKKWLLASPEYAKFVTRFPTTGELEVELPEIDP